jgi:hypothetical protein
LGLGRGAEPARAQGTRHVLDLAGRMRRCGAFVHVSSAYANGHLPRGRLVRERLYPPPGAGARLPAALSGVGAPAGWSRGNACCPSCVEPSHARLRGNAASQLHSGSKPVRHRSVQLLTSDCSAARALAVLHHQVHVCVSAFYAVLSKGVPAGGQATPSWWSSCRAWRQAMPARRCGRRVWGRPIPELLGSYTDMLHACPLPCSTVSAHCNKVFILSGACQRSSGKQSRPPRPGAVQCIC